MATTPILGAPYPVLSDSDNVPRDIKALAEWLEARNGLYTPYCDLRASGTTSIAHNAATNTKVALATTTHNDTAAFTVSSSVITIVQAGLYDIGAKSGFAAPAVANAIELLAVCLNGLAFANAISIAKFTAFTDSAAGVPPLLHYALGAGDTIQLGAYQFQSTGSAALATVADSRLLIRKVG